MFSGRQPHQDVKVVQHYSVWLRLHYQSVAGGVAELKLITRCPTQCCVYISWPWAQVGLRPIWLVRIVKSSWHMPRALYCLLCRAFQQKTAQTNGNDLLSTPMNQSGHISSCTQAQQRYTQHKVGHLVISFGSTNPPAKPWRWGWSHSLQCLQNFTSWRSCLAVNVSLNFDARKASRLITVLNAWTLHRKLVVPVALWKKSETDIHH